MSKIHPDALPAGHILHNVYRIEQTLGGGTFGVTYLAKHIFLNSQWVIKEYLPSFAVRKDGKVAPNHVNYAEHFNHSLGNFFDEAKILHELSHQNIVKVSDLFKENDTAYFVMPYMGSNTLWNWMCSHSTPSVNELSQIFLPLLDGLQYIHERGLLHRDIKPTNILLTTDGKPVFIDFGLARFRFNRDTPMTKFYTPNFAPIEQIGQQAETPTAALDIYSLSGCLYQIITGELPQDSNQRIQNDTLIKVAKHPSYQALYPMNWLMAVDKGLSLNAHERFQTALEMKQALQTQVDTAPLKQPIPDTTEIQQPTPNTPPPKPKSAHPPTPPKKSTPKSPPKPKVAKKQGSGCLGSLWRLIMLGLLGFGSWKAAPWVKTWVEGKPTVPVDKPYRDTIETTIGKQKAIYTGWLKNGIAEDNTGTATIKFADGTTCTVSMSNHQRNGTGKCTYPKGSVYEGDWKNDLKHGYGKYTVAKSSPVLSYEGGFVNGKFSGKGVLSYRNGAVFRGEFANDDIKSNSKGSMTGMFGMASRCEGTFTRSKANCQFKQGSSVIQYSGTHKNGLWNGEGEMATIDNGVETSRYRATFRNGDLVSKLATDSPSKSKSTDETDTASDKNTTQQPASDIDKENLNNLF